MTLAIVVVLGGWALWTARGVYEDLQTAEQQARVVRAALGEGDVERAERALGQLREASDSAADRTDSLPWAITERVPFLGDDAAALATVSSVLSEVARDGVEPLLASAAQVTGDAYAPSGGQFPLEQIAALEEPAEQANAAFVKATERLAEHDPGDLVGPLATAYLGLRDQVASGAEALDVAARAARLMPSFLGAEQDRRYLYVFLNNAEARSGGGLPGNVSLVEAKDGAVDLVEQSSGAAFGRRDEPVLPLSAEEEALYGTQLGTFFLDANFTPDLPRAAELWRAHWQERFGGELDGVFTVDPVTLSYLLEATGPITVQGVELNATNVVDVVESLVYLNQPDPLVQDEFLNQVAETAFDAFADGAGDPVGLIRGLVRGVEEGRVRLHSFDAEDQAVVAGTAIAGELTPADPTRPQVGVYLNDGTGSKMSYYLEHQVEVAALDCQRNRQRLSGRLVLTSTAPADAASLPEAVTGYDVVKRAEIERGQQAVVVQLMAPAASRVSNVVLDGEPTPDPVLTDLAGRPVLPLTVVLSPGQRYEVTWQMSTAAGQDGDTDLEVTPGRLPTTSNATISTAC
ncbi:DUF4012 domain-containing protein [Nocardioides nanhaiensis]|uniref:DUF4012 domain-containing protein n=1 Tax=Nocardioides nanhaiensis TaxID=1476871 RepID=A0ABP8VWB4_9ACTN